MLKLSHRVQEMADDPKGRMSGEQVDRYTLANRQAAALLGSLGIA